MSYTLPEEQIPIFTANYEQANQLASGLLRLKDVPQTKDLEKAKKAIELYKNCLEMIPNHWQTHWLIGKMYQAIDQPETALNHFENALNLEFTNPDLPREASISAMDLGKTNLAITYSQQAIDRAPEDAGLYCNHAMNLMIDSKDKEALEAINKALKIAPKDPITENAYQLIFDVVTKKKPRPTYNDLNEL